MYSPYDHDTYPVYMYPFYLQPVYCCCQSQHIPYERQLETDATFFSESAVAFKQLITGATVILDKLAGSKDFAHNVMDAAQKNETDKVDQLIKSTGVTKAFQIKYNPDGINILLVSQVENIDCCKLTMALRWR